MAIYYFTHESPGAPSGPTYAGAGTMITLLDFCLVTGMGWTKEFSGTNTATYRAPTGNRMYLGIDDSRTDGVIRVRGFETATAAGVAASSGSNPFPNDAQASGGLYVLRASNASNPVTEWTFVSDGKIFYLNTTTYNSSSSRNEAPYLVFGDFTAYSASDNTYNTCIIADTTASGSQGMTLYRTGATATGNTSAVFYPRSYTNLGLSTIGAALGDPYRAGTTSTFKAGGAGGSFPNLVSGTLDLSYIELGQAEGARGRLPGIWYPLHVRPLSRNTVYQGQGAAAGRTFVVRNNSNENSGQVFYEISDTWGT